MNITSMRLTALAAAAWLAACSTLPAQPPGVPPETPERFAQAQGIDAGQRAQPDWWTVFGDPALDALVAQGLAANLDLQQAAERVQRARALAAGRRAELGPSGGVAVGARTQQLADVEAPGLSRDARRTDTASATLGLSWELDLFGRLRHAAAAAQARSEAVDADAQALRLVVAGEIAQAWFALEGAREQARLTRSVIENRRATLSLVQRRVAVGHAAPLDDARARAELAAAEAELPSHEAAARVAQHRIAVLLGQSPSTFEPPLAAAAEARPVTLRLPAPAHWVQVRPDLRAAEARLHAQALDVEAVRAEWLPRLSVAGAIGTIAGSLGALGSGGSAAWFVAPTLSWPVLDAARIDARLAATRAEQREALLAYRQRLLLATEEVESSLAQVAEGQRRLAALQERSRHAATAERLARTRFEAGASDLLELLDAQRGAQQAALGLAAAHTAQRQQLVLLQRALGARFLPEGEAGAAPATVAARVQ